MKKIITILLCTILVGGVFSGCGKESLDGQVIDPTKTQIYTSCYSGGFGSSWIRTAAKTFNENSEEYQVIIMNDNKDDNSTIKAKIESGTSVADVFMASSAIYQLVNADLLMDLTSLYDEKVGDEKLSGKIIDIDQWNYALNFDDKYYGIPHNDGIISAVFDYELFEKNGWLVKDNSGNISAGKDGKLGTYDDGQPVDFEEWENFILDIAASQTYPFIYSGVYKFYVNFFLYNIWAQYLGIENFKLNYTFEGKYIAREDNSETKINTNNGYKMFDIDEGRKLSAVFAEDYMASVLYSHPKSFISSSHSDAQSNYILGFKQAAANPQSAILFDGIWWENEARSVFNSLKEANVAGYGYGEHDYRLLLAPSPDNSYGIDGNGNGSVLTTNENCIFFAKKLTDAHKEIGVKEWLLYLVADEVSAIYTTTTGGVRPFKYSLSTEQYESMTYFARSVWDTYSDYENVKTFRMPLFTYSNPVNYRGPEINLLGSKLGGLTYTNPLNAYLQDFSADDYIGGYTQYINESIWKNSYLSKLDI